MPCGHAWSCCAQTCCLTQPARVRPRSLLWTPPPVGRAEASLAGAPGEGLLRGTGNLRLLAGYCNCSSESLEWGRASAPLGLSCWKGDQLDQVTLSDTQSQAAQGNGPPGARTIKSPEKKPLTPWAEWLLFLHSHAPQAVSLGCQVRDGS